jgi:DNA-directed RNA polymerase specialized sigma24 family protein
MSEGMGDAADDDRHRFLTRVYDEFGPRLYRYALMILADRRDAEDVLQEVFATVLSLRNAPAIDEAGAYFRTAVRNAAYSLLRRRRTARAAAELILEPVMPGCSPTEHVALEQALRSLPPTGGRSGLAGVDSLPARARTASARSPGKMRCAWSAIAGTAHPASVQEP